MSDLCVDLDSDPGSGGTPGAAGRPSVEGGSGGDPGNPPEGGDGGGLPTGDGGTNDAGTSGGQTPGASGKGGGATGATDSGGGSAGTIDSEGGGGTSGGAGGAAAEPSGGEVSGGGADACTDECECLAGQTDCDGACVDLSSDRDHCGDCDIACLASQSCSAGTCSGDGPPSCAAMTGDECRGVSCCATGLVPGGSFPLGRGTEVCAMACVDGCPLDENDETVCDADEVPEREATVSSFLLESFEVTVGRVDNFVAGYDAWRADGHPETDEGAHPRVPGSGWQSEWDELLPGSAAELTTALQSCSETSHDGTSAQQPANCMTWYDAFAFCLWDGGRLPTEVEYEYAAAGGDQNRVYPWGAADPSAELSLAGVTALDDVGSRPAGNARWGHRDLAGSLYDWLFDQYALYPEICDDCASASGGVNRVHRGGDYDAPATRGRVANRYTDGRPPGERLNGVGFRCARDL